MTIRHLDGEQLDRLLAGEELPDDVLEHVEDCLVCRRRRDGFLAAVGSARVPDPADVTLDQLRECALDAWCEPQRPRSVAWRWLAAAAAVAVLAVGASFWTPAPVDDGFNAEAVLAEVDEMLASDPLTLIAPEELVEVVLTEAEPLDLPATT